MPEILRMSELVIVIDFDRIFGFVLLWIEKVLQQESLSINLIDCVLILRKSQLSLHGSRFKHVGVLLVHPCPRLNKVVLKQKLLVAVIGFWEMTLTQILLKHSPVDNPLDNGNVIILEGVALDTPHGMNSKLGSKLSRLAALATKLLWLQMLKFISYVEVFTQVARPFMLAQSDPSTGG